MPQAWAVSSADSASHLHSLISAHLYLNKAITAMEICCLFPLYLQAFARNLFNWLLWQIHARTQADVHTQIHARTFYANPQQQKQLCEPFIKSCFSLQLHRTKYGCNCIQKRWDTCSALTFLNTWLMQVKSLGEIDFLFRAPCVSECTMERESKGIAKLFFFFFFFGSEHYLHQVALSNFPNFNE